MNVDLVEISGNNWRDVASVEPFEDQRHFVAPITRYLCLGHFDGVWRSLGVTVDGKIVGHVMWAYDPDEASHWIGGVVVDRHSQGHGIGRATVALLMKRLKDEEHAESFGLSYDPSNQRARDLYLSMGFVETGEVEDGEVVARLRASGA